MEIISFTCLHCLHPAMLMKLITFYSQLHHKVFDALFTLNDRVYDCDYGIAKIVTIVFIDAIHIERRQHLRKSDVTNDVTRTIANVIAEGE